MDNVEVAILRELTENPQLPFLKIAQKIGVSPRTVQQKYQKMKEEGIILRSSIILDLSQLGYQGKAHVMITNMPGHDKTATINALKKMPNIFLITEIIGEFDVLSIVAVRDFTSIIDTLNTIRKLPSVEHAEATFVTDTRFPVGEEFNKLFPPEKTDV